MYRVQALAILLLIAINTLFWCIPLFLIALLRFLGPAAFENWCTQRAMNIAECWIAVNSSLLRVFGVLHIESDESTRLLIDDLSMNEWYLVICNHQAWADIFILQHLFNRRIPMLKFFIKDALIYVPVIGIAWWVLDFPVMKRYSREKLERRPELRGRDQAATRKACEKFKLAPVSILNFLEGTRFTPAKKERQASTFEHLLPPKAGGAALVISSLGAQLADLIDITIQYPHGPPTLLEFLGGRVAAVSVNMLRHTIPDDMNFSDYDKSEASRAEVKAWINTLWSAKDQQLSRAR